MSNSKSSLSHIQKAGAAVFKAHAELAAVTTDFANKMGTAMKADPSNVGIVPLFESWRTVASLQQELAAIEGKLKAIYQSASQESDASQVAISPLLALPAPTSSAAMGIASNDLAPTDVVIKTRKKYKPRAKKAKLAAKRTKREPRVPGEPRGNAAKLLGHLKGVLNAEADTKINLSDIGRATGIPVGSMTAAIKALTSGGKIVAGTEGGYRLVQAAL